MRDELYEECIREPDRFFKTSDLLALGVIPDDDTELLMACTSSLLQESLFKVSTIGGEAAFKAVKREDAARYATLNNDEALILNCIETAGREGIWRRTINQRTNLHQSVVTRSLKSLETKNIVKEVKNVKYPARKIYMLAALTPSEDVTGGPWFTDGELDTEFVAQLCEVLERYVRERSFFKATHAVHGESLLASGSHSTATMGAASNSGRKRKLADDESTDDRRTKMSNIGSGKRASSSSNKPMTTPMKQKEAITLLPYPPSYHDYPTLEEIMTWINDTGVTQVPLEEDHVRQLMDLLHYDKRVERLARRTDDDVQVFRAVRQPPASPPPFSARAAGGGASSSSSIEDGAGLTRRNAFTEAPCGKCPVFHLCEEGGPVSASTCVYFKQWLEI